MSLENQHLWGRRTLLVVTGVTRGFGLVITTEFIDRFKRISNGLSNLSLFLITKSDRIDLKDIEQCEKVKTVIGSLSKRVTLERIELKLSEFDENYDSVILIHNSGTLGDPTKSIIDYKSENMTALDEHAAVNMSSAIVLTSIVLRKFSNIERKILINVSSLAGIEPFKRLALYSTYKAAREMFFRCVADEFSSVKVINYAPGPLRNTDMTEKLLDQKILTDSDLIEPKVSALKLIEILEQGKFQSGQHIDFFDA